MNFNQVIGSLGTLETGMDITIFESKLTKFFCQIQSKTTFKKEQYYCRQSVRKFTGCFLVYVYLARQTILSMTL